MLKNPLFSLLMLLLLGSCSKKEAGIKRESSAEINSISVIINDELWNGEVGDSIRNKFASPVLGLTQEESLFTIHQFPVKLLEGFASDSRTLIVINKTAKSNYQVVRNQFATPQLVVHISGKSSQVIVDCLDKHSATIASLIRDGEIKAHQKIIRKSVLNPKIIQNKFQINLSVPSDYKYALHKPQLMWLKKEIVSGNNNLLIYSVPIQNIINSKNWVKNIIRTRDSIGMLYVSGSGSKSHMMTEEGYAPYSSKIFFDGKEAFETRGTWELKNDFTSGPFVNYVILDHARKRALILEGFCNSSSKEKRNLMHELEAIIKTVAIFKKVSTVKSTPSNSILAQ